MAISIDTVSLQPVAAPLAPGLARQAPVTAVADRQGANNDRREQARGERNRSTVTFRSFLNAATLAGLTKTLGAERPASTDEAPAKVQRRAKLPDRKDPEVISGDEAESLYRSARSSTKDQTTSEQPVARAREYQAAATRYAKSFFAVSGTFAKPGESLELTA